MATATTRNAPSKLALALCGGQSDCGCDEPYDPDPDFLPDDFEPSPKPTSLLALALAGGENCGTGAGGFKAGNTCAGGGYGKDNGIRTSRTTLGSIKATGAKRTRDYTDGQGRKVVEHRTDDGRLFHEVTHANGRRAFHQVHGGRVAGRARKAAGKVAGVQNERTKPDEKPGVRIVYAERGYNGSDPPGVARDKVGLTYDKGARRHVVDPSMVEEAKRLGYTIERVEVPPPPPLPDDVAERFRQYGLNPADHAPEHQYDEKYKQLNEVLQKKHPINLENDLRLEPRAEVKAAIAKRLAEAIADPEAGSRPTKYDTQTRGGALKASAGTTWGEHAAWRATKGRGHFAEPYTNTYVEHSYRDGGVIRTQYRKVGDAVEGRGIITAHRRVGGADEYLVRPFTAKEAATHGVEFKRQRLAALEQQARVTLVSESASDESKKALREQIDSLRKELGGPVA